MSVPYLPSHFVLQCHFNLYEAVGKSGHESFLNSHKSSGIKYTDRLLNVADLRGVKDVRLVLKMRAIPLVILTFCIKLFWNC